MMLPIQATTRFARSYETATLLLKCFARSALRDLVARMNADPRSWIRAYGSVEGISQDVREVDLSRGDRLLFHVRDGVVYLLDMGKHAVVPRYVATNSLQSELKSAKAPPADLECSRPPGFFTFDVEAEWRTFANEAEPSWISYLDIEQEAVVASVLARLDDQRTDPRAWNLTVILGGPGTGKTSILLTFLIEHSLTIRCQKSSSRMR